MQKENGNKKRKWEAHPTSGTIRIPPYGNYGKRHKEPYRFDSGVCFLCRQAGHTGMECCHSQDRVMTNV